MGLGDRRAVEGTVQEIFDVQILAGVRYPDLLEPADDLLATTFALPAEMVADVRAGLPAPGERVSADSSARPPR